MNFHWVRFPAIDVQCLVHAGIYCPFRRVSKQMHFRPVACQHHRLGGHSLILHRYSPTGLFDGK
jgi:hypothetical protein